MIGGCSSGLTTLMMFRYSLVSSGGKWSLLSTINGTLCGMIATCAFCNLAEPHVTFIVGIFAAFVYTLIHYGMLWMKIDDPLDAVAVHSGGGVFDAENGVTAMHLMWRQLVGIFVITIWSAVCSALMFYILKLNNKLRVPEEIEIRGMDIIKHGEAAYPAEAWKELQYGVSEEFEEGALPPNMSQNRVMENKKESNKLEMNDMSKNDVLVVKEQGSWEKMNKELEKQLMDLDNDSEVVLTVK